MKKSIFYAGNFLSPFGFSRGPGEDLCERFEKTGWKVIRAGTRPGRAARLLEIIWKTLWSARGTDTGIIEVYSGLAFIWAWIAGSFISGFGRRKLILVLHGGGLPDFDKKYSWALNSLLKKASVIVTPSRYLKNFFCARFPGIGYLPNGLDLSKYVFRKRGHARPVLCWLRAFHKIYQPILAVEAVDKLRTDFPGIRLVMAGPDKGDGSLQAVQEKIKQRNLQTNIEIRGNLPHAQVPSFLDEADIFLNTTSLESFGVAMMEAGASGLCIVTTQAGEIPLLWKHGEDCLQAGVSDAADLARAVKCFLEDPSLAQRVSLKAREKALSFDWGRVMPQWKALVEA